MAEFVLKRVNICAAYVLIHKDISNLKKYPLQPHEVFRAKIIDNLDDYGPEVKQVVTEESLHPSQRYRSISGFSAPRSQMRQAIEGFLDAVGEHSRVLVIEEFASPLGLHPIP